MKMVVFLLNWTVAYTIRYTFSVTLALSGQDSVQSAWACSFMLNSYAWLFSFDLHAQ